MPYSASLRWPEGSAGPPVPSALMTTAITGTCSLNPTHFIRFFRMIGFFLSIARFAFKVEGIFHVRSGVDLLLELQL